MLCLRKQAGHTTGGSACRPGRTVRVVAAALMLAGLTGCLTRYHPEPGPFNEGVDQLDQERYADAVASFKRALELYPDDYRSHFNLGCAYDALGRTEAAKEQYEAVLKIQPGNVPARLNLAAQALRAGDRNRAVGLLEEAAGADTDDPRGPSSRAQLALEEGDLAAAERWLKIALERDPEHADTLYRLGRLHEQKKEPAAAAAAYEAAVKSDPEDFASLCRLGALALAGNDPVSSVRYLERATVVRGDFRTAWLDLSGAYLALGRLESALLAAWEARDLAETPEEKARDREHLRDLYRRLLADPGK